MELSSLPVPATAPQPTRPPSRSCAVIRRGPPWLGGYLWLVVNDAVPLFSLFGMALWFRTADFMFRMEKRQFSLWYDPLRSVWYGETALSHHIEPTVISTMNTAMALIFPPIGVFLLLQIRIRNFWDFNHAMWGFFKAIAVMTMLEEIFKRFICRPRPYFLDACQPDGSREGLPRSVYAPVWATMKSCTRHVEPDAMQSFPSGHTGHTFAAAMFLALYLNAKTKAFADHYTLFGSQLIIVIPFVGAGLVSASMIVDKNHHASDVLLSIILGCLCGLLAYRAQYASIFNYRNNHIPLPYRHRYLRFTSRFAPKHSSQEIVSTTGPAGGRQVNAVIPDKYLATTWPFSDNEKRGPYDTKESQPHPTHPSAAGQPITNSRSPYMAIPRPGIDGTSSMNALWSMSRMSNLDGTNGEPSRVSKRPESRETPGSPDTIIKTPMVRRTSLTSSGKTPMIRRTSPTGSGDTVTAGPSSREERKVSSRATRDVSKMV